MPRRGRGGRIESAETAQHRAALDLAIIGVLADGGLRRSEAATLTWGDVELWADGTGRLTVQKGKNQIEPATVAVTTATARALREIQTDDADPAAPVFGLTGEALANWVRAAAKAAGQIPRPHSVARKRLADSSNSRGLARLAVSEKPSSTGRPRRNASMSRTEA